MEIDFFEADLSAFKRRNSNKALKMDVPIPNCLCKSNMLPVVPSDSANSQPKIAERIVLTVPMSNRKWIPALNFDLKFRNEKSSNTAATIIRAIGKWTIRGCSLPKKDHSQN